MELTEESLLKLTELVRLMLSVLEHKRLVFASKLLRNRRRLVAGEVLVGDSVHQ